MDWKLSPAGPFIGFVVGVTGMGGGILHLMTLIGGTAVATVASPVAFVRSFAGRGTPQVAEADTG